ncbi:hypothetical protein KUTeg_007914 [Tegillarca granosa]|uniref:Uncharacterized protein n=1 Tax=Tegillarca granosa TaxID=220873 RepID=A0ABQ9FEQ1_TEGGR|nr:hypothetical protein KUTeg_007914 [Tegillarca granosa]
MSEAVPSCMCTTKDKCFRRVFKTSECQKLFQAVCVQQYDKNFYTFQQIRGRIMTNNFITYYRLLSCIPKCLKDTIKRYCDKVNPGNFRPKDTFFDKIMINKKVKLIYRNLIDNICKQPTEKFLKWEEGCDLRRLDGSRESNRLLQNTLVCVIVTEKRVDTREIFIQKVLLCKTFTIFHYHQKLEVQSNLKMGLGCGFYYIDDSRLRHQNISEYGIALLFVFYSKITLTVMASITSLRVRPLSEKGRQLLEDKVSWFNQKLLCIKSDIDSLIRSVDGRDMNVEEVRKNLLESLQCYEDISINFVCFLETQRSLESDREKVSHLLVRDTLRSKVQKCLLDLKQLDIKIKQRTSSVSSTTSDLRRKKYELNAARAKVKHVELELQEIMRQKKELDARMSLLAVKQEEIKLETEVQELEDLELSNSSVSDSLPLFKYEQISNFDIRNCEHDRNICVDIGFIPPPVEFQDCESVFEKVAAACDVPVLNNITNINSETMTSVPNLSNPTLHHYVNSVIAPANSFDRLPYISSYQKSKASLYKDIYPIPVPPVATPRKDNFPLTYVSDISGSLDNVPSTCKNNSIPLQNSGKIQFMPTRNIMNETYSVHSSSEPDNQSNDSSSQLVFTYVGGECDVSGSDT